MKTETLRVRLEPHLSDALRSEAVALGITPSDLARRILSSALLEVEMAKMDWGKAKLARKPKGDSDAELSSVAVPYAAVIRMRERERRGKEELAAIAAASREIPDWRRKAKDCLGAVERLSPSEAAFVGQMNSLRHKAPTERQAAWLDAIHAKAPKKARVGRGSAT